MMLSIIEIWDDSYPRSISDFKLRAAKLHTFPDILSISETWSCVCVCMYAGCVARIDFCLAGIWTAGV